MDVPAAAWLLLLAAAELAAALRGLAAWPLALAAGALLGPAAGSAAAAAGAVGGAAAAFGRARRLGPARVARRVGAGRLSALEREVARSGWRAVLLARLHPFLPAHRLGLAFGATRVGWRAYLAGSALGCLLPCTALAVSGSALPGLAAGRPSPSAWVGSALLALWLLVPAARKAAAGRSGFLIDETDRSSLSER
ncbi:VTT domain-containing protein [Dissulfurirhabdus thermomarina]|uniref:TVP38/TMEM64 family membrane protein n=1 Tax=Dissulfurirhabdus thermomarina TaxID=1765737 RepID=A0A6N9TLJ9_DISTH|nr:VTT domain-containing protein [Dissulfurirhabdus thermomarina]NDY42152.1 VTT domain-containing protein [Dissulfurirhabdus thermomarina]NMX23086.1 VTT domain-containing protein [Dissulfurirhabdus thermomarina]